MGKRNILKFWGVRGSMAVPGKPTVGFGGNTSCVELRCGDDIIICDAGTGIRMLGKDLIRRHKNDAVIANIMMSHIHLDHIIGLPFFKPMFRRSSEIKIYGPCFNGTDFRRALGAAIAPPYFPIAIPNMGANIELIGISGDKLRIGEVSVTPKRLNHPQGTYGWRFDLANGMSVVHVSDSEPCDESCIDETAEWMFGADMLIHDAQFTPKEYKSRRGWGHSPYTYPIELASRSGIGKLFLFHFDMDASDDDLRAMHRHAQSMIKKKKLRLECELAREGLSIDV